MDDVMIDEFQYFLKFQLLAMCLWRTFADCTWGRQQEHSLCSSHSLWSAAPCMPTRQLNRHLKFFFRILHSIQLLLGNYLSNFCTVYRLSRYKLLIRNGLCWMTCRNLAMMCESASFHYPEKLQSNVSLFEVLMQNNKCL